MSRPVIIGVTGGIGAGKSTAIEAFVERGAVAFSADTAVHALYRTDEVKDAVRDRWGESVFDADGEVDRAKIADIVFERPGERRWLEQLLHPMVGNAWQKFVAEQSKGDEPAKLIVAEVPLLYEAGLEARYDAVVLVTASLPLRLERVGHRAHGVAGASQRAAHQMPEAEKAKRADFIYVNDSDREALSAFVGRVVSDVMVRQ